MGRNKGNKNNNVYKKKNLKKRKKKNKDEKDESQLESFMYQPRKRKKVLNIQKATADNTEVVNLAMTNGVCHIKQNLSSISGSKKNSHKFVIYLIEQMMLKHKIKEKLSDTFFSYEEKNGLDIKFNNIGDITRFVNFLRSFLPIVYKKFKNKYSEINYGIEIAPVGMYDLVCLPQDYYKAFGKSVGPMMVCYEVTNNTFCLIDPSSLKTKLINSKKYFSNPFNPLFVKSALVEFTVMDVKLGDKYTKNGRFYLGDVEVARTEDIGKNDSTHHVKCHFANQLDAGDVVLGYFLKDLNINDKNLESYNSNIIPDLVLVKKKFKHDNKQRYWKIKTFDRTEMEIDRGDDFEDFKNLLEESKALRSNVNLYKDQAFDFSQFKNNKPPVEAEKGIDVVELTELLGNLSLED